MKNKPQLRRDDLVKKFGENLKKAREEAGLSQEELALRAGLSISQIYRIEKGLINTTVSTALHIAENLGVSSKNLFEM